MRCITTLTMLKAELYFGMMCLVFGMEYLLLEVWGILGDDF